jgi:hypothetical protein
MRLLVGRLKATMTLSHFIGVTGPDPVVTFSATPRETAGSGAGHDGSNPQ